MKKEYLSYLLAFFVRFLVSILLFRNHDEKPIQKTAGNANFVATASASFISQSQDREKIATYLAKHHSPLLGTEDSLLTTSSRYGLDYRLILAIARKESSLGKRACGYNVFGIASCRKDFESYEKAYEYLAKLLTQSSYYKKWRKTGELYDLISVYCPESDGCNTNLYLTQLKQFMNEL